MPVKFSGAQYKAFMEDRWGPSPIIEDEQVKVDGELYDAEIRDGSDIPDTALVELRGGMIILDDSADYDAPGNCVKAERFARNWLKSQSHVSVLVSVPRADAKAFKSEMEARGLGAAVLGM